MKIKSLRLSVLCAAALLLLAGPCLSGHTLVVQPDDGRKPVYDAIYSAKSWLGLVIYELDDPWIESALRDAAYRGTPVRILYNYNSFSKWKQGTVRETMSRLEKAGIVTRPAPASFDITHQKTFVMNGTSSLIMSFNLALDYFKKTRDFGILTTVTSEAAEISAGFNADWTNKFFSPSVISLVWSPVNSREKLVSFISSAEKTIDIYAEELEDQKILDALADQAVAGVEVRVICASLESGSGDGNKKGRDFLNSNSAQARHMPNNYLYCHAKMILVDRNYSSSAAFIGSENFSQTSLDKNRELGIIVTERPITKRLAAVFEKDWPNCRKER